MIPPFAAAAALPVGGGRDGCVRGILGAAPAPYASYLRWRHPTSLFGQNSAPIG